MPPRSVYVHIPFCKGICAYCDFPKVLYKEDWAESYLSALFAEFSLRGIGSVDTIYVGGGTPSALSLPQLDSLLSFLSPHLSPGGEFSLEGNPESLTAEKVGLLRHFGVNRVSLGVQSSLPKYLSLLGRKHRFEQAREAVGRLKEAGIGNLNVDWMIALPGETMADIKEEERSFLGLDVPHLSVYTLILERGTEFWRRGIQEASQDEQGEQYEEVLSFLRGQGYDRYEVSNFARPGMQCRHNLAYWKDEEYYGVGMGASGFVGNIRYKNTSSLSSYLKGEGLSLSQEESGAEEFFLTNLRLEKGFSLEEYSRRFHSSFLEDYQGECAKLVGQGLLRVENGRVFPSDRGMELLDLILLELFR